MNCHTTLQKFVENNTKNQNLLVKNLNLLTSFLAVPVYQIPLICEIFRDNFELCSKVSDEFLNAFIELIIEEGRQPIFLEIFEVIQIVKGKPIREIQRKIIQIFSSHKKQFFLLYMKDELGVFDFSDFNQLLHTNPYYADVPFQYHAKLLHILTLCGTGSTGISLTEAKCQKILPLTQLFQLLFLAEGAEGNYKLLKIPLLNFFYHIYHDTEKHFEGLLHNIQFLDYIHVQTSNLNHIMTFSNNFSSIFAIWIKILTAYHMKTLEKAINYLTEDHHAIKKYLNIVSQKTFEITKYIQISMETYENLGYLQHEFQVRNLFEPTMVDDILADEIHSERDLPDSMFSRTKNNWNVFVKHLIYDIEFIPYLEDEKNMLRIIMFNIDHFTDFSFEKLLKKLVNFIRMSTYRKGDNVVVVKTIELLSDIISHPMNNTKDFKNKAKFKTHIQTILNSYGITKVVLNLLCDKSIDDAMLKSLLTFCVKLLDGGNPNVQNEFFQYFVSVSNSEVFFETLYTKMSDYMDSMNKNTKKPSRIIYKISEGLIQTCLRLMQVLCENHNEKLQNYLRHQDKLRNSYDLVEATVSLIGKLLKGKQLIHYFELSQCFDTLTEIVQGPCYTNQNCIIESRFLEYSSDLLSISEFSEGMGRFDIITETNITPLISSRMLANKCEDNKPLKGWMIAHLKMKCMITLHSLLEGRNDNYIIIRMIRAFNIEIFKANLIEQYSKYIRMYGKGYYENDIFFHYSKNNEYILGKSDNKQDYESEYYTLLIEVGFHIYHLLKKFDDCNDQETKDYFTEQLPKGGPPPKEFVISGFIFLKEIVILAASTCKRCYNALARRVNRSVHNRIPNFEYTEITKQSISATYEFFEKNTGNIEVMFRNKILCKVYFWLLPEAFHLTKEVKESFHTNVNRSSEKAKIQYLMKKHTELIEEMKHEAWLAQLLNRHSFFAVIASNVIFYRDFALKVTLVLNFIILTSFPDKPDDEFIPKPLLFVGFRDEEILSETMTSVLFTVLGILLVISTGIITFFFILQKGPVLAKRGWEKRNRKENRRGRRRPQGKIRRLLGKIKTGYYTTKDVLKNIHILYHVFYLVFAILGLVVHPFFFAWHLTEIIYKYNSLQNVINSIVIPRKALFLTFLLTLILVYIFSLIGYAAFYDHFDGQCTNLLTCLSVVYNQGFKNGGGIGGFMDQFRDPYYYSRLLYDSAYNIVILIIMLNIVQGIITDTFAILRDKHERDTEDRMNKCFICGIDSETIERGTYHSFAYHSHQEHNEWNYIFFIHYLKHKDPIEYTGIESYVMSLIKRKEINWFPLFKSLSLNKKTLNIDNAQLEQLKSLDEKIQKLSSEIQSMKSLFQVSN